MEKTGFLTKKLEFEEHFKKGNSLTNIYFYIEKKMKYVSKHANQIIDQELRLILSNGEDIRIEAFIVEDDVDEYDRYLKENTAICMNNVLCIERSKGKDDEKYLPFEFHINHMTVIEIVGVFEKKSGAYTIIPDLLLKDTNWFVTTFMGLSQIPSGKFIELSGGLKHGFRAVSIPGSNKRYAISFIANGTHMVPLIVKNFTRKSEIVAKKFRPLKGIRVYGTLEVELNQMMKIVCQDIYFIYNDSEYNLTAEEAFRQHETIFQN